MENKISTSELRLGNWVYDGKNTKFPMQVETIMEDSIYLDFEGNEGDVIECSYKNIEPIPITSELLKQMGFVKHSLCGYREHFVYKYKESNRIELTALFDCDFSLNICGIAKIISNLHHLQNIMFDLFGEELEIKREYL